jgi:hypothetical protein
MVEAFVSKMGGGGGSFSRKFYHFIARGGVPYPHIGEGKKMGCKGIEACEETREMKAGLLATGLLSIGLLGSQQG